MSVSDIIWNYRLDWDLRGRYKKITFKVTVSWSKGKEKLKESLYKGVCSHLCGNGDWMRCIKTYLVEFWTLMLLDHRKITGGKVVTSVIREMDGIVWWGRFLMMSEGARTLEREGTGERPRAPGCDELNGQEKCKNLPHWEFQARGTRLEKSCFEGHDYPASSFI